MSRSTTLATLVVVTAVAGSVLVLLVPGAVTTGSRPGWLLWSLVGVVAACGAAAVLVRRRQ